MTTEVKLDCYAVLGVGPSADDEHIRAAFAELTRKYNPKRFPGEADEAQKKLSELTAAYETLADPARRRRYDIHRRISSLAAEFDARDPSLAPRSAVAAKPATATAKPRRGLGWYALIAVLLGLTALAWFAYSKRELVTRSPAPAAAPAAPATVDAGPAAKIQASQPTQTPQAAQPPPLAAETPPIPAPQAATTPKEATSASAKPAPEKNIAAGNATPAAAVPEACTDVLLALGLCKPKSTGKDR